MKIVALVDEGVNFKGRTQTMKVDAKLYSANQLSICDSFANWMQASDIPKDRLRDVRKTVYKKPGTYTKSLFYRIASG